MSLKVSNKIKDEFLKDNYCKGLIKALKKVKAEYRLDSQWKQVGELVFAYELYHQWRKKLDSSNPDELILNGEAKKYIPSYKHKQRPDLILHRLDNNENNHIVCEIKICKSRDIKKDFNKLRYMMKHSHESSENRRLNATDYKYAVFIYTGESLSDITEFIPKQKKYNEIICIHSPSETDLEITTLGELKKQINI